MQNYFNKIAPLLQSIKNPSRYIASEYNSPNIDENADQFNFCMVYPDIYDIGQSNNAVSILCDYINDLSGFAAQRSYLPHPETIRIFKANDISMFSLETSSPLNEFDAIGITVSHELLATNIIEVLDFSNISIISSERTNSEPFIFGGGPMCNNPEPFHAFFDVITIGEGEVATINCLKELKRLKNLGFDREHILHELSKLDSIYVPSMYEYDCSLGFAKPIYDDIPKTIKKAVFNDFSNTSAYKKTIVPYAQITHNRLNIEILRGCARGCRFCQAGFMYRPVRERSKSNICKGAFDGICDTGFDELSLVSLSSTDHSQIKEILKTLNSKFEGRGVSISIPSQRLDSFGVEMAKLVSGNKKSGLTFAPEAGSQRLRNVINKNVSEQDLFDAIFSAFSNQWRRVKLYFMIGLPTENDDDVIAIANLCEKCLSIAKKAIGKGKKSSIVISVSIAIFIPKSQTPFMWDGQISSFEVKRRVSLIKKNLKSKQIKLRWHDSKSSTIESVLSRGGRECCDLIYAAWKNGSHFDAWDEYFDYSAWDKAAISSGMDLSAIASKCFKPGTVMPWNHIDMGLKDDFLLQERIKADKEITSQDCTFTNCYNCGVCNNLKSKNTIIARR